MSSNQPNDFSSNHLQHTDPNTQSSHSFEHQQPFDPAVLSYQVPPALPQGYATTSHPYGSPLYGAPPPPPPPPPNFQTSFPAQTLYGEQFELKSAYPPQQPGYESLHDEEGALGAFPRVVYPSEGLTKENLQDVILARDYQVEIRKWFSQSWEVYKQHWPSLSLFTVFRFTLMFLPYLGAWLSVGLGMGLFIAVSNKIRAGNLDKPLKYDHLFYGFLFYIPTWIIAVSSFFLFAIGFLLCIIPGFYVIIVLSFSLNAFIEFHHLDVGLIGAMILSQRVVNKKFFEVTSFLIVNFLFAFAGILCFGVGGLITIPVAEISVVFAFQEMFGLIADKPQTKSCVVC